MVRVRSDRYWLRGERGTALPLFAEQASRAIVIAGAAVVRIVLEVETPAGTTGLAGRACLHALTVQAELAGFAGLSAVPAVLAVGPDIDALVVAGNLIRGADDSRCYHWCGSGDSGGDRRSGCDNGDFSRGICPHRSGCYNFDI